MPELSFEIVGVEPVARGLTPLLHFKLLLQTAVSDQTIQAAILQAQIQIQAPQRRYSPVEKQRLSDLFGPPERWGQTLRNRLWAHAHATTGSFEGRTEVLLPVPCTFDLNVLATKYFYALEEGEVPLIFLFSGSLFYTAADGRLQVQPISWDKECHYRLSLSIWQKLMDHHYPHSAWLTLRRDVLDRLYQFKRTRGLATWEETIEELLPNLEESEVSV